MNNKELNKALKDMHLEYYDYESLMQSIHLMVPRTIYVDSEPAVEAAAAEGSPRPRLSLSQI